MADAAFKTAAYPSYTTAELRDYIAGGFDYNGSAKAEIARREAVAAGDVSAMTPGERLRHSKRARHVTIETGPGGTTVMVEPERRNGLDRRVFRQEPDDTYVWAHYADWRKNGERARFYAYAPKELPTTMTFGDSCRK